MWGISNKRIDVFTYISETNSVYVRKSANIKKTVDHDHFHRMNINDQKFLGLWSFFSVGKIN